MYLRLHHWLICTKDIEDSFGDRDWKRTEDRKKVIGNREERNEIG